MANFIEQFPVPIIFKKIMKDSLCGELIVETESITKRFYFIDGILKNSYSNDVNDRLGEILFRNGILTHPQYKEMSKLRAVTEEKYGKLLVKHKIMTRQELYSSLQDQVKTIALTTFAMTKGMWSFKIGKQPEPPAERYNISVPVLIIEGCRSNKNLSYFINRYGLRAPMTLSIPEDLGRLLNPDDFRFYFKLSKCRVIASEKILTMLDMPEETFWQRMSMLFLLNIIDFTDFKIDSKLQRQPEVYRNIENALKTGSIDLYQHLELKDTASINEVREKYFSLTKKTLSSDTPEFPIPLDEFQDEFMIERNDTPPTEFNIEASQTSDNGDVRKESVENIEKDEKEKSFSASIRTEMLRRKPFEKNNTQTSKNLYLRAHRLYEESRYVEAARLLEEAVRIDGTSPPSYYLLLGLIQMRIPQYRHEAEKNLLKASNLEPWNADPLYYLGQLYWNENCVKIAEKYYRKALKINMEHTMALRMVEKIEKSNKKVTFPFFRSKKK